jgi:23S rRNA (uracil1939-C5)-methyltransferase
MQEGALPDDARHFRAIAGDKEMSVVDDRGRGVRDISRTIHGEKYNLNAASFFQANSDLTPQLIDNAIGEARGERAIELYCGVGLFTLALARRFEKVVGVESDSPAADFARRNLGDANSGDAQIVNQDVANWLETLECAGTDGALDHTALQIDFLLLDPPRMGAESRVISGILKLKPKKICYVSCDPATLARDLKKLIAGGYSIDRMTAFDMFPQTHHVETVVHLLTN